MDDLTPTQLNGNAYVLPNGEILGDNENVLFQHATAQDGAYPPKGTLTNWQRDIGQYLAGNSRLCLFAGASFASPLLKWFNLEGGILHVYGQSSSGKSTAQRVTLSIWGHGKDAGYLWNATGYALTNASASRNDGLLSLDESAKTANKPLKLVLTPLPTDVDDYKARKTVVIAPKCAFVCWREMTLKAHFLRGGREAMAGQIVRCPSIPHKLETSHGFENFKAFANHLK